MSKTLVKSKIVLEDNGNSLIIYLWRSKYIIFGYWYPFGVISSSRNIDINIVNNINDESVSKLLFDNLLNK